MMSDTPLAILHAGVVCGVGNDSPSTCSAIRGGLNKFEATPFSDDDGEWIIASHASLPKRWRGRERLVQALVLAIGECLRREPEALRFGLPLLLCVAEPERPGHLPWPANRTRIDLDKRLTARFHPQASAVLALGRVGALMALAQARTLINQHGFRHVLIAAVDSLITAQTLAALERDERLLTSQNSNGFVPGEAAGAVLVGLPDQNARSQLLCTGLGFGAEPARVGGDVPLRAQGLTQAIRAAVLDGQCQVGDLDYRIADISGEQFGFKEAALALSRTLRQRKAKFPLWLPAESTGEVGAAIGPVMLAVALEASRKGWSIGPGLLAHSGNDAGLRAAAVLRTVGAEASA